VPGRRDHDGAGTDLIMTVRGGLAARLVLVLAAAVVLPLLQAAPADAATTLYRVEQRLAALGYPTGKVDGVQTSWTRQALCAWRETHGMSVGRWSMTAADARSVLAARTRPSTSRSNGLYVNVKCQILYQVVGHGYRRIVRVSTGMAGYRTPTGTGYVWRKWPGWHRSSLYAASMYDSIYWRRDRPGVALHGSVSDSLVKSYPASHGCIRVPRAAITAIYRETRIGTKVVVYGRW
jgi:hypothetical protein